MPCHTSGDGRLTVCSVAGELKQSNNVRPRKRFCFKCRKRTMYRLWLFIPGLDSYYGPTPSWKCDECNGEHDLFPGMTREWEE